MVIKTRYNLAWGNDILDILCLQRYNILKSLLLIKNSIPNSYKEICWIFYINHMLL